MTPEELAERLLEFSAKVGAIVDALPKGLLAGHVGQQLLQTGTAAGPDYEQARAEARPEPFLHWLGGAMGQLRRARFWLRLIARANLLPGVEVREADEECSQLIGIMEQSMRTAAAQAVRQGPLGPWGPDDTRVTLFAFPFAIVSVGRPPGGGPPAAKAKDT